MFASIHGITIHYHLAGAKSATPLVFLNSLGSSLCMWDEVATRLGQSYATLCYDKRGHGLSDCPPGPYTIRDHATDLAGLLDQVQVQQAILIGVSVGGLIALDFAAQHPARVQALVLCDTGARIGTAQLWDERMAAVQANGLDALAPAILARWFANGFVLAQPAAYRGYTNMLLRTPAAGYVATCAALRDADLRAVVPTIQAPALVLCGDEDLATPPSLGRELAAALPNARFELIVQAAHLPSIEQPERLATKITQFLIGVKHD